MLRKLRSLLFPTSFPKQHQECNGEHKWRERTPYDWRTGVRRCEYCGEVEYLGLHR